jgi:hypothetical protein
MRFPLAFPMPCRAPEGDGGGEPAPAAAAPAAPAAPAPAAPASPTGLMDLAEPPAADPAAPADPSAPPADPAATPAKATFKTRPDWLPEPFYDPKTGEVKLEALAKSQADLRAAISKGANKAPAKADDYKLEMEPAALDGVKRLFAEGDPAKDPLMKAVREAAHESGMSQAQFNGLMAKVLPALAEQQPPAFDAAAELKALHPDATQAKKIVNAMAARGQKLVEQGVLTKDDLGEFAVMVGTANGMKVMSKIFEYHGEQPISADLLQTAANSPSASALEGRVAEISKMPAGPAQEAAWAAYQAEMAKVYGNAPAGRSIVQG